MSYQMSEHSFASLLVKCTLIDIMFKYYKDHTGKPAEMFYIYKCQMSKPRTMLNINSDIDSGILTQNK